MLPRDGVSCPRDGRKFMNSQQLQGRWNQVKGQLKEKWGQLTDDDLQQFNGNADQLVGVIQRRTGDTRQQIEQAVEQMLSDSSSMVSRATEAATEYANAASEQFRNTYDNVSEQFQGGYEQAEEMVRSRPAESIAVALGVGVVTGLMIGLCVRR